MISREAGGAPDAASLPPRIFAAWSTRSGPTTGWRVEAIRRGLLVAACSLALPPAGLAQTAAEPRPRLEISGGLSSIDGDAVVDGHGAGWMVGAGWRTTARLAMVVEAGSNRLRRDTGLLHVTADFHQLMAGARFTFGAGRLRPFAQALVGGSRIDYAASASYPFDTLGVFDETRWAWQVGAGGDIPLTSTSSRRLLLRLGVDFRRVRTFAPLGQARLHAALAYGFLHRQESAP